MAEFQYLSYDKQLLLDAVSEYDAFSVSERKLLLVLINLSIDDNVDISCKTAAKAIGKSESLAYKIFKKLEDSNFIRKANPKIASIKSYILNTVKLKTVIEHYIKKLDLEQKTTESDKIIIK